MKLTTLSNIKKGEYFRFPIKKKVYTFEGKDRNFGYSYSDFDDVNNFHHTQSDRKIEIDFDF